VKKKKVPVRTIDDFTAEKVEIELTLTQGSDQQKTIEALYAFTKCETSITSRLICLKNNRPVEMNIDEVLRENTRQLLDILERELVLKKEKLLDAFHHKTLVQIFIENRIYKAIESCKTYEAVQQAVLKGLKPFADQLKRPVVDEDVEMLLGVRIKRISLFDIEKNRADIEAVLTELAEVEKHLQSLKNYATRYLKNLIKTYKNIYPRRTEATGFAEVEVRELTATELQIRQDENGYIGTSVKGEIIMECSSLDKLLMVYGNGRYQVMSPPDKLFIDHDLVRCAIYNRESAFTAVYTEKGIAYIKRFQVGGAIMNRDYFMGASEKSKLLLLTEGTPESLYVKYRPAKNQRIHQQRFNPADTPMKGAKARGNRLSSKSIKYIDTQPGRWWDKSDDGSYPEGVLL
jgi:topoisomerase-4 subunit A